MGRRREGSGREKCKGKNNVSGEKDKKKLGKRRKNGKEVRVKKNYGGRGNLENEENKTKPKS